MRRALAALLGAALSTVLFVTAVGFALVLHLGQPSIRRLVAVEVNKVLGGLGFEGRLVVSEPAAIALGRVSGVSATLYGPRGDVVATARGASATIDLPQLLASLLESRGPLRIRLRKVMVEDADVDLERGPDGELSVAAAWRPKEANPEGSDKGPAGPPGRVVLVDLDDVTIAHTGVRAHVGEGAPLRLTAFDTGGEIHTGTVGTTVLARARVTGEGLLEGRASDMEMTGEVTVRVDEGRRDIDVSLDGSLGGLPVSLRAAMRRDDVAAWLDAPAADARAWRRILPEVPLEDSVALHVHAGGKLPAPTAVALLEVGRGSAVVSATIDLGANHADVLVTADAVSPRSFFRDGPDVRVSARGACEVAWPSERAGASCSVTTLPFAVAGRVVPPATLLAKVTAQGIDGHVDSGGPRAHAEGVVSLRLGPPVVAFDLRGAARDPPELTGLLGGSAKARARGELRFDPLRLEVALDGSASDLRAGPVRLGRAEASARLSGLLSAVSIDGTLRAEEVALGPLLFAHGELAAHGPLGAPTLSAALEQRGVRVEASARHLRLGQRGFDAEQLRLTGLGAPIDADVHTRPGRVSLWAKAPEIDLGRGARLLGRTGHEARDGRLSFEGALESTRGGVTSGQATLALDAVELFGVAGAHLRATAHLDALRGETEVHARAKGAVVDVTASGTRAAGELDELRSWTGTTGRIDVAASLELPQLAPLARLLGADPRRVLPTEGRVELAAHVARKRATETPEIEVHAKSHGLVVDNVRGLDARLDADVAEDGGPMQAVVEIDDAHGHLVDASFRADWPLADLLRAPARAIDRLSSVPLALHVGVPDRTFADLPEWLGLPSWSGRVRANLDVNGTLVAPTATMELRGTELRTTRRANAPASAKAEEPPRELRVEARYDGTTLAASGQVNEGGDEVLEAHARASARWSDVLRRVVSEGASPPWRASADLRLARFRLESLPFLATLGARGLVSGAVSLDGLHEDAVLHADSAFSGVRLAGATFTSGALKVDEARGALHASANLTSADGALAATASLGVAWGSALAPSVLTEGPADVSLRAKAFRARALLPLVRGDVSDSDGRIDGAARIHLAGDGSPPVVEGSITVNDGRVEMPLLGQQFHDVRGRLVVERDGRLHLLDASGRGTTGRFTVSGTAALSGLAFAWAKGTLAIAQKEKIPIAFQGIPVGEVWGRLELSAVRSRDGRDLLVDVDAPSLQLEVPPQAVRSVQSLDQDPTIQIGKLTGGRLVPLALAAPEAPHTGRALHLRIAVRLGQDVRVRRGSDLDVVVNGRPVVDVDDVTMISGQIFLLSGNVDVAGKRFVVERGTVTFGGEPSNPEIVATAYWDAPDSTRVFADVTGRVRSLHVKLRAEPARTEAEIISLVLYGTTEGPAAAPAAAGGNAAATQAAGALSGYVTEGLNKLLSSVSPFQVQARVDTTQAQNPRPEVEVQISKDVAVEVIYNVGIPTPGQSPDRTELRVDWRFAPRWSLEGLIGDQGSSILDLIWHLRY